MFQKKLGFGKFFLGDFVEKYKPGDSVIDFNKLGPLWQPAIINTQRVNSNLINIGNLYETIKTKRNKLHSKNNFFKLLMVLGVFVGIGGFILIKHILPIIVGVLFFMPYVGLRSFLSNISKDIIKVQIAEENNWLYDPEKDYSSWSQLRHNYKEIFNKGDESQCLEDQFWGSVKKDNKDYYFNTGLFHYTTVSRDSKGRTQRHPHIEHFIGVRLNKKINSRFYLYPENVFSKIGNFFTKKEINTQSIEFNKTFAFSYNGKKSEQGMEIVQTLSPAVQQKLIQLKKENGSVRILFCDDSVFFNFNGTMMNSYETDLLKDSNISEKDKALFNKKINTLIDISSDISKYLD